VLRGLLAYETQLTKLELPSHPTVPEDMSAIHQQLGSLTALRHLDVYKAWWVPKPTPSDCRALGRLHQLTTLAMPFGLQVRLACPLSC
jgi:hypothetical protein